MSQSNDNGTERQFSLIFRLTFVVVLTGVLLLIAEVGLRLFGPNLGTIRDLVEATDDPRPFVLKANNTIRFEGLHVKLPEAVTWVINGQGIRAHRSIPPNSEKFRVATYGDSETYGWSVDFDDTFQRQMEMIDGRVEVINFGVPGYNVTNVADTIELTAVKYHPDLRSTNRARKSSETHRLAWSDLSERSTGSRGFAIATIFRWYLPF
jgi:hypothetical protein